jgi:hypothetical protein
MDWQPIETAPKDGMLILAYDGQEGYPCAVVRWVAHWGAWAGYYSGVDPLDEPTHWMPIPVPPVMGVPSPTENTQASSDG